VRAPVRIAGVKVGEVASVVLDPQSFDAVATLRISSDAGELPADTAAAIYTSGLLGDRYVGLAPGGDPEPLKDGDEILLTQSAVVLEQLIGQFMFGNGESGENAGTTPSATE
jgi:phospholipid/cholesterol/gamma-HCH transport system substrate-binding protein